MLNAQDQKDLATSLSSIDLEVPRRSEGRTTEQVERYAIAYLLSTLNKKGKLSFPLSATQEDRPDFVLKHGETIVGIEHTEAVSQNEAHKSVLRDKFGSSDVYFISHTSPSDRKKNAKQLLREIEADEPGDGWVGNSVEREWSEAMFHFTQTKLSKFSKPGFRKFQENWLLIYDNWSLPALKRKLGSKYFYEQLIESNAFEKFNKVFVLSGRKMCEFRRNGFKLYKIENP